MPHATKPNPSKTMAIESIANFHPKIHESAFIL